MANRPQQFEWHREAHHLGPFLDSKHTHMYNKKTPDQPQWSDMLLPPVACKVKELICQHLATHLDPDDAAKHLVLAATSQDAL